MSVKDVELQLQSFQEFINLIQDNQLQQSLRLSKTKSILLNKKKYNKKPLTSTQFREIAKGFSKLNTMKGEEQIDLLVDLRTSAADYYFGIPKDVFDQHFEQLNPIMEGCILVTTSGLSPDIDFDKLLLEYRKKYSKNYQV